MNTQQSGNLENLDNFAISRELYQWIVDNIPEGSTILEFGSGSGTVELTRRYTVYSVEHDPRWVGHCEASNYIHAPIVEYGSYQWYDRDIVRSNLPQHYDLIIIDGPPNNPETEVIGRQGFIENMEMFNTNVPMIFDDVNRQDEYQNMVDAAKMLGKEFEIHKGWQKSFAVVS